MRSIDESLVRVDEADYGPLRFRTLLLPVAQGGQQFGPWAAIIGWMNESPLLLQIGLVMYVGAFALTNTSDPIPKCLREKE